MAKKRIKPISPADRHKPRKMVGLPPRVYHLLRELARRNKRPLTWEIRRLVEEEAERMGLEVPPPEADEDG
jgi:hypothetical protein